MAIQSIEARRRLAEERGLVMLEGPEFLDVSRWPLPEYGMAYYGPDAAGWWNHMQNYPEMH